MFIFFLSEKNAVCLVHFEEVGNFSVILVRFLKKDIALPPLCCTCLDEWFWADSCDGSEALDGFG